MSGGMQLYHPQQVLGQISGQFPAQSVRRVVARPMQVKRMVSHDSFSSLSSTSSVTMEMSTSDDDDVVEDFIDSPTGPSNISFRCDKCGKKYKQRNSLYKHQWEHSEFWEPTARRFNMSKHQQVQAMQAAMQLMNFSTAGEYDWTKDLPEVRFLDLK